MLHYRSVKIWKHVDVSFGVFEYEVSQDSRQKRSDHSPSDGRFCFLILCRQKVNLFLLQAALKKLFGKLETTVRVKNVFSPPLFRIFAKTLRIDLLILFFSGSAHAKFENFSTTINTSDFQTFSACDALRKLKMRRTKKIEKNFAAHLLQTKLL